MKDIKELPQYLKKMGDKVLNNLKNAQSDTADDILSELHATANADTGAWRSAIYRTPTTYEGDTIETKIISDTRVSTLGGKTYNLARLLEYGTSPHTIYPVNSKYLVFEINGEKIFAKKVNHPGTVAYNNFHNALENNKPVYEDRIKSAIKEATK